MTVRAERGNNEFKLSVPTDDVGTEALEQFAHQYLMTPRIFTPSRMC
ncbi:unannotated protein [freshwater metagenome]|uniref:Unannotated protein n=1 Tax=freshwater metagenome TaxID=449393 RepID=A0A6J7EZH8_9ZZZZ